MKNLEHARYIFLLLSFASFPALAEDEVEIQLRNGAQIQGAVLEELILVVREEEEDFEVYRVSTASIGSIDGDKIAFRNESAGWWSISKDTPKGEISTVLKILEGGGEPGRPASYKSVFGLPEIVEKVRQVNLEGNWRLHKSAPMRVTTPAGKSLSVKPDEISSLHRTQH